MENLEDVKIEWELKATVGDLVQVLETSKYGFMHHGNEINPNYIGRIYKVEKVNENEIEIDDGYCLVHDEYLVVESI